MSNETDDNEDLFKQAMQGVNRLQSDKADLQKKPVNIAAKRKTVKEPGIADTLSDEFIPPCEDHLEFMRPGVQKSFLKQIRNGKISTEDVLDLHGYRRDQARTTLLGFLEHAQQQQFKLVRVIHGKGYNSSDNRPVLKAMVNKWLQSIPEVLAFVSATPRDGGMGAVYVLLKKRSETAN